MGSIEEHAYVNLSYTHTHTEVCMGTYMSSVDTHTACVYNIHEHTNKFLSWKSFFFHFDRRSNES